MISLRHVTRRFRARGTTITALDNVSMDVERGQFVTIHGASGSGKSTLLLTLGGMLRPHEGTVGVAETDLYQLSRGQLARFRAQHIGFVFQMFHLLPYLDVRQNIRLGAVARHDTGKRTDTWLERVGLQQRSRHRPGQLSVGECQRTALARALVSQPDLILADEPTGNLDSENTEEVLRMLSEFCQGGGTVVVVTHGSEADEYADRQYRLHNGKLRDRGMFSESDDRETGKSPRH